MSSLQRKDNYGNINSMCVICYGLNEKCDCIVNSRHCLAYKDGCNINHRYHICDYCKSLNANHTFVNCPNIYI